jgi:hypothetical protein
LRTWPNAAIGEARAAHARRQPPIQAEKAGSTRHDALFRSSVQNTCSEHLF